MIDEFPAAVLRQPGGDFEFAQLRRSTLRPDEVRVRLVATGLCHADILSRDQVFPIQLPAVLGHEGPGIVEAVGGKVVNLQIGDHVVLGFNFCGRCANCLSGVPGDCETTAAHNFSGVRPDGEPTLFEGERVVSGWYFGQSSFAAVAHVPERIAVRVSKGLPLDLLAPLGCSVMTGVGSVLNVLNPRIGSSMAVFGAGAVGMSAIMAARLRGCSTIIAVDLVEERLALALELGATAVVNAHSCDPVAQIREITHGKGVENAIDAAGPVHVFGQLVASLGTRGHGVLVSAAPAGSQVRLDLNASLGAAHRISFVLEGDAHPQTFVPALIDLIAGGQLPIDRIIRRYPFRDLNQAVADSLAGRAIKPVMIFD